MQSPLILDLTIGACIGRSRVLPSEKGGGLSKCRQPKIEVLQPSLQSQHVCTTSSVAIVAAKSVWLVT